MNVEGSDFYKQIRAEAEAKEEKEKKLGSSDEDGGGGEEEEDGGVLEAALTLEDKGWTAPTLKNNFFEEHDEYDAQEEAEDEPGELPRQVKLERPTILERGVSREAKRAYNTEPRTIPEED